MKIGKIPENIWKRSVRKEIKNNIFETGGIGIGSDAVLLENACVSEQCLVPFCRQMGALSIYGAVNALYARLAEPEALMLSLYLDGRCSEDFVKHVAKDADLTAERLNVKIAGFDVHILQGLKKSFITCTALGRGGAPVRRALAGEDVVVTGYMGLTGSIILADNEGEKLVERYPRSYIEEIFNFEELLSCREEAKIAALHGASHIRSIFEGGILRSLWEMAEISQKGLTAELKSIPLKQETVEACNFLDINPYKLMSGGSLLFTVKDGASAVRALGEKGIRAAVIGSVTDSNDKVILNEDEKTFITQPGQDEIYKIV